ncbi:MAG: hypothetical protein AAF561_14310 [Planctomycetota bacterium]
MVINAGATLSGTATSPFVELNTGFSFDVPFFINSGGTVDVSGDGTLVQAVANVGGMRKSQMHVRDGATFEGSFTVENGSANDESTLLFSSGGTFPHTGGTVEVGSNGRLIVRDPEANFGMSNRFSTLAIGGVFDRPGQALFDEASDTVIYDVHLAADDGKAGPAIKIENGPRLTVPGEFRVLAELPDDSLGSGQRT